MVYAAIIVLYAVHAHLLFRVGVTVEQWEFWALMTCLVLVNAIASRPRKRSWRWRRWL